MSLSPQARWLAAAGVHGHHPWVHSALYTMSTRHQEPRGSACLLCGFLWEPMIFPKPRTLQKVKYGASHEGAPGCKFSAQKPRRVPSRQRGLIMLSFKTHLESGHTPSLGIGWSNREYLMAPRWAQQWTSPPHLQQLGLNSHPKKEKSEMKGMVWDTELACCRSAQGHAMQHRPLTV